MTCGSTPSNSSSLRGGDGGNHEEFEARVKAEVQRRLNTEGLSPGAVTKQKADRG